MIKVGLLSDTHAYWDDKYAEYFKDCDEIWHAGDIGSDLLAAKFEALKPFRAVYGNIDGQAIRLQYPKVAHFKVEDVNVMMTHIGGYPGRYNPEIRKELYDTRPNLFISGHSHILKVVFDRSLKCLHMNPGAALQISELFLKIFAKYPGTQVLLDLFRCPKLSATALTLI